MSKTYAPPADLVANTHVNAAQYEEMYSASVSDPVSFWKDQADRLDWVTKPTKIKNVSYEFENVSIKWYEDGELNVSANCIDRHLATRGDQTAII